MRGVYRRRVKLRRVAEFFGLVISLVVMLFVLMPVLTFIRMGRVTRELDELRRRVEALELKTRPELSTTSAATAEAAVAPPPSLVPSFDSGAAEGVLSPPRDIPPTPPPGARFQFPLETTADTEDLEERLGGRGLLYTGVLVLLFGVSFFLKYAFDNAWINETGRVVLGLFAGTALVTGGLRLAAHDLAVFGHALAGTGFAILYIAIYAALNFYALINQPTALLLMTLVTVGAAVIAHRQRAQALAFIAVGGGLLTPFLVGGDDTAQLTLFSYVAVIVAGTMWLALRHRWLALNAVSYIGTLMIVVAWAADSYTDALWLRTLLFLTLYCVLFLIILRETSRIEGATARLVRLLLWTAPALYHVAAIIITGQNPPAIHIYLIAFTATGLWLTADRHRPVIRLLVLLGAFVPMFGTLTLPDGLSWTVPNVVTIVAVAALHLVALLDRVFRQEECLDGTELVTLHLAGIGLFALLYEALQPAYPELRGALAAIVALVAVATWQLLRERDPVASLNAVALAFTLVAIGIAVQFDGPTVVVGWAAEGAAVTWLGLRTSRRTFQFGGAVLWVLAVSRLLDSFSSTPANFTAVLNARSVATLFVVSLGYALARMFSHSDAPEAGRIRTGLHIITSFLTLMWVTAEIKSFWEVRYLSAQAHLYEQMLLSLAWGVYGALLILFGMKRSYAPMRYIGMTVLAVTIMKVFLYDLWELGGIYRVVGFLGFGVLLVLVSYLYQKRRVVTRPSSAPSLPDDDATS